MKRLQIQLIVGFDWYEACCRSLDSFSHGVGVAKIILVSLSKRLGIADGDLLHIVTKRGKVTSNIMRRHTGFDANEAARQICEPRIDPSSRDLFSQNDGTTRIKTNHVQCVLTHIDAEGGHCVKAGGAAHGGLLRLKSPAHSDTCRGRERG